jgi:hypothetical protein
LHRLEPAGSQLDHGISHRARHIARFLVHGFIPIQRVVTGRMQLVITDATVQSRLCACVYETHPVEPVRQGAARAFDTGHIAVNVVGGHPTNSYWLQGYSPHVVGREIQVPDSFDALLMDADRDLGCGANGCLI